MVWNKFKFYSNNNVGAICDNLFIHITDFTQWCKETKATEYSTLLE